MFTCEFLIERHLIEWVDGLFGVSDDEGVDVVFRKELGGLQAVNQVIGHVLDEHRTGSWSKHTDYT